MSDAGILLESRVQRLFLAQGVFAERGLFPAADVGHRLIATDIDVLASEYTSGFHLTRRHAECKSGKRVQILDRVLWLSGVRSMLDADASYLVLESFDEDATDFARSLRIDVMTAKQLETWEKALHISSDLWPNRSNFKVIDPLKNAALRRSRQREASEKDKLIRQVIQFIEIDSWREFSYARLNRLLRLLKALSEESGGKASDKVSADGIQYCASALLVRFCQYLLAICRDVSRVPISDLHSYLLSRLTYGDYEPRRVRGLVQTTVEWMSQALRDQGLTVPREVDSNRLFRPPSFCDGLVALVQRILSTPNDARYLPIAMETEQFGTKEENDTLPLLSSAWNVGKDLISLVKGFAVASVGVDTDLLSPLKETLNPTYANEAVRSYSVETQAPLE